MSHTQEAPYQVYVYRIVAGLLFCAISFLLPWWVLIVAGFLWAVLYGRIIEPIIAASFHDILFAIPEDRFFGYLFVETLFVCIAVAVGAYFHHHAR